MIDSKYDIANLNRYFENFGANENRGIAAGGCYRPDRPSPDITIADPIFGGGIDRRDKYEREEMFEQKTGWMDNLVDAFGFDDTRVYGENGKIVVDAGMGSDTVNVAKGKNGGLTVEVNGRKFEFTAEQAKNLEIRGGSGDDTIRVADNVKIGVTIRGGSGDDTIKGGRGNDFISGGSGNDKIDGGRGNDWIHAGSGNDDVQGDAAATPFMPVRATTQCAAGAAATRFTAASGATICAATAGATTSRAISPTAQSTADAATTR